MSHTPGPWRVDETKATGAYGVWTDYATHPGHDGAGYESQIAAMPVMQAEIPREQRDSNARLIAAAPELLAACRYSADSFAQVPSDKTVPPIVLHDCREKLEAAIKKAIGE